MEPPESQPPRGRYLLEEQLGVGGMGVVHVALDTHLQRRVALKVVSTQLAGSPEFRERFQREAATLARLDSPHIIAIYDHGEQDGLPFLATQLVRGGDLGDLIASRGRLAPAQAVTVTSQVADALNDAHRAGIVHRDIKPSNVLVRDPDAARLHVYLCDFGIAVDETSDRLTTAGGVVGTWSYLAPERSHGEPATPASDIYALGCLLWVCLTGAAPYAGTDLRVVMSHVGSPVRQLVGDDPYVRHLNEVLARTMAKDPAHRYRDAAAVRDALEATPSAWSSSGGLVPVPLPDQGVAATPTQVSGSPRPTAPPPMSLPPASPPASLAPASPPASLAPTSAPPPRSPARTAPLPGPPSYAPPAPAGPARRRGVLAVVAALAAVLVVVGLAVVLTRGDDEPDRAGDTASDPVTTSEPSEPTEPSSSEPGTSPPATDPARLVDASVGGDIDGDGLGDAVATFQDGTDGLAMLHVMFSTGTSFRVSYRPTDAPDFATYGDIDGDEVDDSVSAVTLERGRVRLTSSLAGLDGQVYDGVRVVNDVGFVDPLVGDVDGDDDNDLLLWGQSDERTVTVWALLNDGSTLGDAQPWLVLEQSHVYTTTLSLADYDNDGMADLLAVLPTGQIDFQGAGTFYDGPRGTRLYSSEGIGFTAAGPLTEDSVLETNAVLRPGDYSGDGTPLVALSDPSGLGVSIYDVTADGITSRPRMHVDLPRSSYVASARFVPSDVDGDGDDDLVLTRKTSDQDYQDVQVALSEGDRFAAAEVWAPAPSACTGTICIFALSPTS